jgi:hypothetical protein
VGGQRESQEYQRSICVQRSLTIILPASNERCGTCLPSHLRGVARNAVLKWAKTVEISRGDERVVTWFHEQSLHLHVNTGVCAHHVGGSYRAPEAVELLHRAYAVLQTFGL